jgi:trimeric autotransporter adhesin
MLARWGLIYVLGVVALILCGVVGWQQEMISAERDRHQIALEKFETLEKEAKAAVSAAASASRQATDLKNQIDREKRDHEATATKAAAASQSIDSAETAKTEAEAARKSAEAQLAAELEAKTAMETALSEARAEADNMRVKAETATKEAEAARTELAKLKAIKSSETGSITPRAIPAPIQKTPVAAAAALTTPAKPVEAPNAPEAQKLEVQKVVSPPAAVSKPAQKQQRAKAVAKPRPKPKPEAAPSTYLSY